MKPDEKLLYYKKALENLEKLKNDLEFSLARALKEEDFKELDEVLKALNSLDEARNRLSNIIRKV